MFSGATEKDQWHKLGWSRRPRWATQINFLTPTKFISRVCVSGVKNVSFSKIWRALFSWYLRLEIRPFALLPTISGSEIYRILKKLLLMIV